MKTILVPTDFSKAADCAAEYAARFAKEVNAEIHLLKVYHVPVVASETPVIAINQEELQEENERQLKRLAAHLKRISGNKVTYKAVFGFAVDEVVEESQQVSLVVMGMQGASKINELLLGSITTATLTKIQTPVLIIPQGVNYNSPKKIVFACDYNAGTDAHIIDTLKSIIKDFKSKVFVLNIRNAGSAMDTTVDEAVAGIKIESHLSDVEHEYYFAEGEDLVKGINQFVEDKQADIIAIVPHRYSLIERLFHKSISRKMAFHTHVPVLALPDNHKTVDAYFI
jgi:nucleotide-binding universal stress UspA family protein